MFASSHATCLYTVRNGGLPPQPTYGMLSDAYDPVDPIELGFPSALVPEKRLQ